MATELNPPNSDAVVYAADDVVDVYKAAGFVEVKAKKAAPSKSEK